MPPRIGLRCQGIMIILRVLLARLRRSSSPMACFSCVVWSLTVSKPQLLRPRMHFHAPRNASPAFLGECCRPCSCPSPNPAPSDILSKHTCVLDLILPTLTSTDNTTKAYSSLSRGHWTVSDDPTPPSSVLRARSSLARRCMVGSAFRFVARSESPSRPVLLQLEPYTTMYR